MKPILKNLDTNSHISLADLCEVEPRMFGYWLNASISADEFDGIQNFQLFACTASWLERQKNHRGVVPEKYFLVEDECTAEAVRSCIEEFLASCEAATWLDVVALISRRADWEYENYRT